MAYHDTVTLAAGVWGKLSPAGAVAGKMTIIPQAGAILLAVQATDVAPANTPAGLAKALSLGVNRGCVGTTIADLFPGATGTFLWGWSQSGGPVFVSHA